MLLHEPATPQHEAPAEHLDRAVVNVGREQSGSLLACALCPDCSSKRLEVLAGHRTHVAENAISKWPLVQRYKHVSGNQRFAALKGAIIAEEFCESGLPLGADLEDFQRGLPPFRGGCLR